MFFGNQFYGKKLLVCEEAEIVGKMDSRTVIAFRFRFHLG